MGPGYGPDASLASELLHLRVSLPPLRPAAILFQLELASFHERAGDGGVGAKLLERRGIDLPAQRLAGLGDWRHAAFEEEGEFDARVAGLLVQGLAQQLQEGGQLAMARVEEPGDFAHEPGDLRIQRVALLQIDPRALLVDDDVA